MSIIIKPADEANLASILSILNHAIVHTTAVYDYEPRQPEDIAQWFTEKQQGNFPVIIALENDTVLGYATYAPFKNKEGYKFCVEHSVYVAEGHAGKGIGKLLMTELIQLAKAQNLHTIIALIDADNIGSIIFHEKLGFSKTGVLKQVGYKFNRWLDLQFMQLTLN